MGEKKRTPTLCFIEVGAKKGGEARAAALSAEQRREIAQGRLGRGGRKPGKDQSAAVT